MKGTRQLGEALFSQRFHQIERTVRTATVQRQLSVTESQELYSLVMLKVIEDDYAVLRRFRGKSRWGTYLTVVTQRVLLDHREKEWGRWRPGAVARRLGTTAIRLDQRINRDGLGPAAAIQELLSRGVNEATTELEQLVELIPRRPRRRILLGDEHLRPLADRERADQRVEATEHQDASAHLSTALASALNDLPDRERNLLGLRFGRGWTVRRIAASQDLEARPLYRRFERILRQLRRHLEGIGLNWKEIAGAFDGHDIDLKIDLR